MLKSSANEEALRYAYADLQAYRKIMDDAQLAINKAKRDFDAALRKYWDCAAGDGPIVFDSTITVEPEFPLLDAARELNEKGW